MDHGGDRALHQVKRGEGGKVAAEISKTEIIPGVS